MSSQAVRHHVALFGDAPWRDDAADEPGWLGDRRQEAIDRFAELGFPARSLEDWRYTNVAAIERADFRSPDLDAATPSLADIEAISHPDDGGACAVFVDGRLRLELSSLPAAGGGVHVASLRAARGGQDGSALVEEHLTRYANTKESAFTALNTAFLDDGAVIEVFANATQQRTLRLFFLSTGDGTATHPRVLVVARPGSELTLIQQFASLGEGVQLCNSVCEMAIEANARLDLVTVQHPNRASFHVSEAVVQQARDSRFTSHTLTLGGAFVRNQLETTLADTGAEADLRGLFLGTGSQHIDNHTLVDHAMPHCTSNELYKGVLADHSRGVFRGRVVVRPDAQKTDAQQSNPNLLLSGNAEIDTKPQLEIYADDVKCSHGSTIGQLDEDALFYLQSRGVGGDDARALLTRGFAHEVTDGLPTEALSSWAGGLVDARLSELFGGSR